MHCAHDDAGNKTRRQGYLLRVTLAAQQLPVDVVLSVGGYVTTLYTAKNETLGV